MKMSSSYHQAWRVVLAAGCLSSMDVVTEAFHPSDEVYFHSKTGLGPSMWHFSEDGLKIWHPTTGTVLKDPPKSQTCEPYEVVDEDTNTTELVEDCRYFSFGMDGERYVWAGGRAASDRVEAFDIDTGDRVGYTNTCRVPMSMGYHPGRREMYVHCHTAEVDVFSVHSLGLDHEAISLETGGFPSGRIMIHSAMGHYGYSANSAFNGLIEIDLAGRNVQAFHELPKADSARQMAFSAVNRHLYVRVRVCCTCGFAGADVLSCGRRPGSPVNVVTGPSQGTGVNGTCGSGCEGSRADTIGVYEFDTVAREVVGSWNIDPTNGFGADPVATPDGSYVLLFGADGGRAVSVLKPGSNGQLSTKVAEVPVDFQGGLPGDVVIDDFAHIKDEKRSIVVLGASTDNAIVLVDMNDGFRTHRLALTSAAESTGGSERQLEWAVGTDFVWVTGGDARELYMVEVPENNMKDARVVKTISNVPSGDLLFVDNFSRKSATQAMEVMVSELGDIVTDDSGLRKIVPFAATEITQHSDDDGDGDTTAIAALAVACVALLMSFAVAVVLFTTKSNTAEITDVDTTAGNGPSDNKTLGSKMVA